MGPVHFFANDRRPKTILIHYPMEFTIHQIAVMLDGEVQGDGTQKINMLAKIQDAKKGQKGNLSFFEIGRAHV